MANNVGTDTTQNTILLKKYKVMKMKTNCKFTEEQLQLAWCRLKRDNRMEAVDGQAVFVPFPGIWNLEAGPDFRNAKLAIGDKELIGRVEVHKKSSDWVNHGHWKDPLYSDVILHVVAEDDAENSSEEIRKRLPDVPVVIIKPIVSAKRIAPADKFPQGKFRSFFSTLEDIELNRFFQKAGLNRFNAKAYYILSLIEEKGIHTAFTELIFDSCGYRQNRNAFLELYQRVSRYNDLNEKETEAVIWGESGLLPDPGSIKLEKKMERFVKELWSIWWQIRKEPLAEIKWNHTGLRPMNFPERRISALTMLLKKMGKFPLMFFADLAKQETEPAVFVKKIIKTLKCSHPVWNGYINCTNTCKTPASVLGASRAADICVNVVLPALKAHTVLFERQIDNQTIPLQNTLAERAFISMPAIQSNRILETASLKWFTPPGRKRNIVKSAVAQQGVLNIFRNFCEDVCFECKECPLANLMNK